MPDIKRLNYFTSQFLVEQDFNDEQAYHVGMRRRLNRSLHSWGVADSGLVVEKTGPKEVTIGPGMAIDKDGREIVLLSSSVVSLSTFVANTDVYVSLQYQDVQDQADRYTAGGVNNYVRWTERPQVVAAVAQPLSDGSVIPLAKVRMDASGNAGTPDQSIRRIAGSKIDPGSNLGIRTTAPNYPLSLGSVMANTKLAIWDNGAGGVAFGLGAQTNQFRFHLNGTSDRFSFLNGAGGTEVLTVAGSGNVGIGTSQPGAKLEINGGDLLLKGAAEDAGDIVFKSGSGTQKARIWSQAAAGTGLFLSSGDGTADVAIDSSGRVGLGTDSPDRSLSIVNATGSNYMNVKDGTREILLGVETAGGVLSVMTNHDLVIRAGSNSEKMRITAAGNVGIGTTSPGTRLHVIGGSPSVGGVVIEGAGGATPALELKDQAATPNRWWVGSGVSTGTDGKFAIYDFRQSAHRLVIDTSGKVGIGTTAPGAKLEVVGSGADSIDLKVNGRIQSNSNDGGLWVAGDRFVGGLNTNQLGLWNNNGWRLVVQNNGDVTIGGNLSTHGRSVIPRSGWAGGIKTWDVEAEGSLWAQNAFKPGGGGWGDLSDINLKKNVASLENALDRLLQLRGVTFEWKDPDDHGGLSGCQIGLVAQEVEEVFPDWVGSFPDGTKHVTVRGFEALTIEAFRELHAIVGSLRRRVEAIEQRLGVAVAAAPSAEGEAGTGESEQKDLGAETPKSARKRPRKSDAEQAG